MLAGSLPLGEDDLFAGLPPLDMDPPLEVAPQGKVDSDMMSKPHGVKTPVGVKQLEESEKDEEEELFVGLPPLFQDEDDDDLFAGLPPLDSAGMNDDSPEGRQPPKKTPKAPAADAGRKVCPPQPPLTPPAGDSEEQLFAGLPSINEMLEGVTPLDLDAPPALRADGDEHSTRPAGRRGRKEAAWDELLSTKPGVPSPQQSQDALQPDFPTSDIDPQENPLADPLGLPDALGDDILGSDAPLGALDV